MARRLRRLQSLGAWGGVLSAIETAGERRQEHGDETKSRLDSDYSIVMVSTPFDGRLSPFVRECVSRAISA
eukprot:6199268-Pleurochrysis_carterae.AAC.1